MNTILVKNMVCSRCVMVVNQLLQEIGVKDFQVDLGRVVFDSPLTADQRITFQHKLEEVGFEILTSEEDQTIERIKALLRKQVENVNRPNDVGLKELISREFPKNYKQLSTLFSESEGKTMERYFIELKIEKVKEYIKYEKLSISEISYELGYSSPQHLSKQFKQITGMTTSAFRKTGDRKKLDNL
ncbi:MAG: helix-turn-helix domain-containing protein [Flavobacteriales bacterium]|nr:helix-turn-helix domain-containing protein [Flavobacteriales bacterium]